MTDTVKILAMHEGMPTLFPSKPDSWEFMDVSSGVETVIADRGGEVEILLSASIEKLDKAMLDKFPNLKMIASVSAGFSNVDLEECRQRGIAVTNAPGLNSGDVADVAVSMMTSLLLNFPQSQNYIMTDQWVTKDGPIRHSLKTSTVGIVGLGAIGKEAVTRLKPFGVELCWWGPRDKQDVDIPFIASIKELAKKCRGLIVCCRPDDSTFHLIDDEIIKLLGQDGVIVNVSRGNVVDENALIEALKTGKLGGAGLDVFDPEPTNSNRWEGVPNVILTPHQGGATYQSLFASAGLAQQNIQNFLSGAPLVTSVL
ncbi:NAD(P)-dependent oxidoreductase [Hirschia maritima]|uniref:NAD(P)-dependent oxidoreductase n=1 Tax=Hirschia maritima TaxID=1121961 RepID=UPI0003720232|nr:NAD(P)-dependent oxidoreductase [Hirschia maritima]